jgi:hypothetical protein
MKPALQRSLTGTDNKSALSDQAPCQPARATAEGTE